MATEVATQSVAENLLATKVVLLVDDQPDVLELLSEVFTTEGYDILVALDGEAAAEMARARRPDLIILDLMLLGESGQHVLSALAADPGARDVPVLVLSAHTERLERTPQVKAVVQKPFDVWRIVDVASRIIDAS